MARKKEFPNRDKDDKALEEGERVARARYFRGLRFRAKEILEDVDADYGEIDDEALHDRIYEDAANATIYTRDCIDTIRFSDNWMAINEEEDTTEDFSAKICQAAFFAYRADLAQMVEALRDEYED